MSLSAVYFWYLLSASSTSYCAPYEMAKEPAIPPMIAPTIAPTGPPQAIPKAAPA
jgi:hypothetical protein